MEKIPPGERFSHNPRVANISDEFLARAISFAGYNFQKSQIQKLSGGFMNANYLIVTDQNKFILRIYSSDISIAQREFDTLKFLATTVVKVPQVFQIFICENHPVVVMEYIPGISLEHRLMKSNIPLSLYENLGKELAHIHNINLGKTGFLNAGMEVGNEYEKFSVFVKDFILRVLKQLESRPDRLDLETINRVIKLIQDKWQAIIDAENTIQLAHCDFNPKNILVSETGDKVISIIDWEFTLSGSGLIDLGNFFRFSYDYEKGAQEAFHKGYLAINSDLPQNWRDLSRLIDLGNMCSFLERPEDYHKTFRTARIIINNTLEYFRY